MFAVHLHHAYYLKFECLSTLNYLQKTTETDSKVKNKVCNLPVIDPFDPTIMKMIEKVPPLACKGEKNLTFYQNGKLMITPGMANIKLMAVQDWNIVVANPKPDLSSLPVSPEDFQFLAR